jgi:pantoate--beta-alanine ligase
VITSHLPIEVRSFVESARREGKSVGFVPTMGALHAGHRTLMERAGEECDLVVASIFVNPMQFDNQEDLDSYPSTLDSDLQTCREVGVALVYAPNASTMYPAGFDSRVVVGRIGSILEGRSRTGHYDGVATVVTKLFNIVVPDVAYFGQKDFQQTLVVNRIVTDLDLPTVIRVVPTVRESDGLALSSRNVRLDPTARQRAVAIPRALTEVAGMFGRGEREASKLEARASEIMVEAGLSVDYVSVASSSDLRPTPIAAVGDVILIAAIVDEVRLIDNAILGR